MESLSRILVGIDLARTSSSPEWSISVPVQCAVEQAFQIAESTSAQLTFLVVYDLPHGPTHPDAPDITLESIRARVFECLNPLLETASDRGLDAVIRMTVGRPDRELVRCAIEQHSDLLIVGTKDQGRFSHGMFGSTASKVLRSCPCPVWVAKPDDRDGEFHIMVATDLTEVGDQLLQMGVELARLQEARLLVLHSIENHTDLRIRFSDLSDDEVKKIHDNRIDEAEQLLHQQLATTDYRTLQWGMQVEVTDGPADQVILQSVEDHRIDLLLIGTVARSGLMGVLIGNTAERLLPDLRCSILAVKPRNFQCPISTED